MQIFISHAPEDDRIANRLRAALISLGYQVWIDHMNMPAGTVWVDVISQVLQQSEVLLLFVSRISLASIRVRKEWDEFLAQNRRIIPLKLDGSPVPLLLGDLPFVDFSDGDNWQQAFDQLARMLPSLPIDDGKPVQPSIAIHICGGPAQPPPAEDSPALPPITVPITPAPPKPVPALDEEPQGQPPSLSDRIRDAIDDVIEIFNPPRAASVPEEKPAPPAAEAPQQAPATESAKSAQPPPPPVQPITAPGAPPPAKPAKKREEAKAEPEPFEMAGEAEEHEPIEDVTDQDEVLIIADKETALPAPANAPVMFSAYPPKVTKRDEWQPLLAYVFRETAAQAVIADALQQLGDKQMGKSVVTIKGKVPVAEGAEIVARPTMAGFQFKPLEIKIGFYDEWQRFNFELRAKDAPLNQFATGSITFFVEGVIVGDVPLSVYVGEENAGGEISSAVTRMYQAIFCSYSHDDTKIVERVERAYKALGLDYLRDITTLKSGTEWSEELLKLIDRADIFQLFWSQAAADSPYVRQEWLHALKLESNKNGFIRPVYWKQPIPSVPGELRHIHFAFQPDLDD